MKKLIFVILVGALIASFGCKEEKKQVQRKADSEYFHEAMQQLSNVLVDNIFSPPAASRVYAYPTIAAYEALQVGHSDYQSLAGQLNGLTEVPKPDTSAGEVYYPLSSLRAFTEVSKNLVFTEVGIDSFTQKLFADFKNSEMDKATFERSMAYGDSVAKHILAWMNEDGYKEIRGRKHTVGLEEYEWKPTGPAYMEAIEPYWNQLRPFVIDSATQFIPVRPTAFSKDKNSQFYKEMLEVYETKKNLSEEQSEIAAFWDCNPYVMNVTGHVMFATKKITPGGHWISIVKLVSKKAELDMMEAVEAYTRTSIALADAFISCWDEKYRSNLIRPETVIQELIDPTWQPLLQTPPFPEYTSGHSVISTAAAMALTELLGDNFAFVDSSEKPFGLPSREFDSFMEASQEAAISRLYGGIHYMPAIRNGQLQGRKVGNYINEHLQTRIKEDVSMK